MKERMSLDRIDELLRVVFEQLKKMGGRARPKDIFAAVEPRLKLTEYECERTRSGAVRWETHLRFYSIDLEKAAYLQRSGGYWTLTEQGEHALALPKGELVRSATKKYRDWKSAQPVRLEEPTEGVAVEPEEIEREAVYEQAVETARIEIDQHLRDLGAFDFQNLIAELLRAMGYHVPHVAEPGPDGGIDIVAYRDPLGTTAPRIKVQVKHRDQKITVKEVRELEGLLRKEGDIGLIVSSAGFTADAEREIRPSTKHIEAMDLDRVVALWQEHYDRLRESGKALLPLVKVYFLAPKEE